MILRCCICDYTSQYGSALLDKAPSPSIKILYIPKHSGYYCTDCINSWMQSDEKEEQEDTPEVPDCLVEDLNESEILPD